MNRRNLESKLSHIASRVEKKLTKRETIVAKQERIAEINHFLKHPVPLGRSNNTAPIIISLTSYGHRVNTVEKTIISLLNQSISPEKIILYLDNETDSSNLPETLLSLTDLGLVIRDGVANIRGHKKYVYSIREFPDKCILTVDDDLIYPYDLVESLYTFHMKFPKSVVANRVHRMKFDSNGLLLPYKDWAYEYRWGVKSPSLELLPTGCGGVLYPPHALPDSCFDIASIRKYALSADDVWLKCAEVVNDVRVVHARLKVFRTFPLWEIEGTQQVSLFEENVNLGGNDVALMQAMQHFSLRDSDFTD